ncbi:hypothetical protein [Bacillus sp. AFS031507]|uniref:hypothetical protein n=1 Tax=Bacillus sp. AFS031507 TaxID=2033496 RepID=UPI000BFDE0A1|nr:hypothetical protein [Bacillus sp. AFS031507]PGY03456.1 hypothetical protein COE25_29770 [Bacillus sp. AFS031507]
MLLPNNLLSSLDKIVLICACAVAKVDNFWMLSMTDALFNVSPLLKLTVPANKTANKMTRLTITPITILQIQDLNNCNF